MSAMPYIDGNLVYGSSLQPCQVVGIPADVLRWKLVQRNTDITVLYLKRGDGRFEKWSVGFSDETRRAVKPGFLMGRNTTKVIFK